MTVRKILLMVSVFLHYELNEIFYSKFLKEQVFSNSEVITWSELIKEEEDEKEKDAALYGAQDFNSCTYTQAS